MKLQIRNTPDRYGWVARVLHWTTVALVMTLFIDISGLDVPPKNANRDAVVAFHVSLGIVVLFLMAIRAGWRLANPNPVRGYALSRTHRFAAITLHRTLYAVVVSLCLSGIIGVTSGGEPLVAFRMMLLQSGSGADPQWQAVALDLHNRLWALLLGLIAVHVVAAIINQVHAGDRSGPRDTTIST